MPRFKSYDDDSEPIDPQEEAYKRAGLAASNEAIRNAPKQDILESLRRLGEGNIDQPGSEAYYKYGAGKGRSIEAAKDQAKAANPMADDSRRITARQTAAPTTKALAARSPSKMPAYEGRSADRLADIQNENSPSETALMKRQALSQPSMGEDKRSDMDDFKEAPARTKQVSSTPPIVTKEELAASGMSLRDYLNAKQRRGGTTSPKSMPGGSSAPSPALMPNRGGQPGGSVPTKRPRGQGTVMEQGRGVSLYGDSLASLLKKDPNKKSFFKANDERIANLKKGGSVKNMSTGGSASKRGDGIAQRGKTKGKLC